LERVLVVGANGWVASRLAAIIREKNPRLILRGMDITAQRDAKLYDQFVVGDITKEADVAQALDGVDTVFHVVALFQGTESLLRRVNVTGVEVVLQGCLTSNSVRRLVYTSSASVVYDGEEIVMGNEDLPYCKGGLDPYNHTKSVAEAMVLVANGKLNAAGQVFFTCAIRPHSIYGPGDPISWPSMLTNARDGKLKWRIAEDKYYSSYTYIDNLCTCEYLAALSLAEGGSSSPAAGQKYNVNDGVELKFWERLYEVSELSGLDRSNFGKISLVAIFPIIYQIAWFFWSIGRPLGTFTPYVLKLTTTTHTYSIDRARRDLAYVPLDFQTSWDTTKASFLNWPAKNPKKGKSFAQQALFWVLAIGVAVVASYWVFTRSTTH